MSLIRLAVTGKQGQVARALAERAVEHAVEIVAVGRPELDLSEPSSIRSVLETAKPDAIVSAAAYTSVDRAEQEPEIAFSVNATGAGAVAGVARDLAVPIIHLSTDYVFNGDSHRPYRENDPTGPIGAYGRSKLAGEIEVVSRTANSAVLRTAWVYSPFGANFLKTMLRLAETRDEIAVVADQRGNPTSALDIADGIIVVAKNLLADPDSAALRGVFHMTGTGETTWAEFAEAIFAASAALGGPYAKVRPIPSTDYPTPAKRPANSRLDCSKLAFAHRVALPPWRQSVRACVERVLTERKASAAAT
jgi:dTDP-4-dehydrorhamnose reductase